ncbi:hypothetical protein ACFC3F_11520 [Microbacterium sp. NPDC055910]|uniref:hypothetical protein n=1 Tax=Microbacterium sp. NPDC055910 TaxID=3345659 RepID=UPI0035D74010
MTARTYAEDVVAGRADFSWSGLENAAYAGSADVQALLAQSQEEWRRAPRDPARAWLDALRAIVEFWPIVAFGLVVVPIRLDGDPAPAAIVAGVGGIVYIVSRWLWWLRPGADVSASAALLSFAGAALAAVTAGLFLFIAPWVPASGIWFAIFVLMALAGAVTGVVVTIRGRRHGPHPAPSALERARRIHRALPVERREAVKGDLAAALVVLEGAGVVDARDARLAAHTQPLLLTRAFALREHRPTVEGAQS